MSHSGSVRTPVSPVGCTSSVHDAALDTARNSESHGAVPGRVARRSSGTNGTGPGHRATISTPPSVKLPGPVSPFLSSVPGRSSGGGGGAPGIGLVGCNNSEGGTRGSIGSGKGAAGRPSPTANRCRLVMYRKAATAGLGGPMLYAAATPNAPSSSSSAVAGEVTSLSQIRFYDHPRPRSRGSRSPLVTPGTTGSRATTPVLRVANKGSEPPSMILDFLYLGTVQDAQDASFLSRANISVIINVSMEEYWAADKNIVVRTFRIEDNVNAKISVYFQPAIMIIEKARRLYYRAKEGGTERCPRVLVHCQKGRSRSATIVLAYLIARNGWSVAEALEYVTRRRRCVEPNFGFMEALRDLQESMSAAERTKRYSLQTLLVKNISASTAPETVRAFFEAHVGCVRDVVMHSRAPMPPQPESGDEKAGGCPSSAATDAKEEAAAVATPENTLCLVFFACFEDVKRARDFAAREPDELTKLGPVPGKSVKLVAPVKASGGSAGATSAFPCGAGTAAGAASSTPPPPPPSAPSSDGGALPTAVSTRRRDRPSA